MKERTDRVESSIWTRLYFGWAMLWGALMTIVLATGMLLHSLIRPTPATFRFWLRAWGKAILFGAGIRLRVEERTVIPQDQPVVFVANHQNMVDILTCAAGIDHHYGFAAKAALRGMPFIGQVLRRSPCIFVDRSSPRRAAESMIEAARVIRGGNSVLIYAEGERTYGSEVKPFLRGAFVLALEAGVPIVPVTIRNNYSVIDERRRVARPGRVTKVIGAPIVTAGRSRSEIPALMDEARAAILAELEGIAAEGAPMPTVSLASTRPSAR